MSLINFDSFRTRRPDLTRAWNALESWLRRHPEASCFEITRLADELYPLPAFDLANSLEILAGAGCVAPRLRVKDPRGVFVPGEYKSYAEIPAELPDRLHQYIFSVGSKNVVPVYYLEPVNGP